MTSLAVLYLRDGRMAIEVTDTRGTYRLACPVVPPGPRRQRVFELVLARQYGEAVLVAKRGLDDPKSDTFAAEHAVLETLIADRPGSAHLNDEAA